MWYVAFGMAILFANECMVNTFSTNNLAYALAVPLRVVGTRAANHSSVVNHRVTDGATVSKANAQKEET